MQLKQPRLLLACALVLLLGSPSIAKEYRIATQEDFARLRASTFEPGDAILFKRGARFSGMFAPLGQGTKEAPIRIEAYGKGERPRIDAQGKNKAGLFLLNPAFWEVGGLEITNTDGTDKDQGDLFGIYVLAEDKEAVYKHIHINDCYVHDVNGKVAGKRRGGIHIHIKGLEASKFHDLRITNNRIVRVGGVGIGNTSPCGKVMISKEGNVTTKNLWTKVYVADNYIDHTGRNCIIARVSKDAIYERNTLANSSRYSTGHSIFNFNTDGIKIQFNEAYGNVGPGGKDRGGFDADYNSANTFIQYNYSHDNLWFCGIMKKPNHKVTIRYNLSQNDQHGIYFFGFEGKKDAKNIRIYNNTHYVKKGLKVQVFPEERTPINSLFENNIFYFEGEGEAQWGPKAKGINTLFKNNLYFNIAPHCSEKKALVADPQFVAPGKAGKNIDLKTMDALAGYRLSPSSPGQEGATKIKENGGKNILNEDVGPDDRRYGAL